MRSQTELAVLGVAAVFLAFFSWPVPKMVKDLYHTGVGRLAVLGAIIYLAKFQSVPLAILLAIYYTKAVHAAYTEGFEAKKDDKKEEKKDDKKETDPSRLTSSGSLPASKGSAAGASASSSSKTEHYQNFMPF